MRKTYRARGGAHNAGERIRGERWSAVHLTLRQVFSARAGGAVHMCSHLDSSLDPPPDIVLRIITVPASFARSLPNPFNLTMLEHHAKNVGLRRARGRWLLVNNPDTLPSPDVVPFVAHANKQWPRSSAAFYRAHRMSLALPPTIALAPALPPDVRVSRLERMLEMSLVASSASLGADDSDVAWKDGAFEADAVGWDYPIILGDDSCLDGPPPLDTRLANGSALADVLRRLGPSGQLYSMASGDFVMMSRQAMRAVGGYVQVAQNWNMDSFMLCQAVGTGLQQVILSLPCAVIHQYHPRTRYYASFSRQMYTEFADNVVVDSGVCNRMLCMGGRCTTPFPLCIFVTLWQGTTWATLPACTSTMRRTAWAGAIRTNTLKTLPCGRMVHSCKCIHSLPPASWWLCAVAASAACCLLWRWAAAEADLKLLGSDDSAGFCESACSNRKTRFLRNGKHVSFVTENTFPS